MENNSTSEKKPILKPCANYGAIMGAILISISILSYMLDMSQSFVIGLINYVILATLLFYFAKKYRDDVNDGSISYGRAYGVSVLTALFASIILGFYTFLFFKLIAPEAIDKMLIEVEEKLIQQNPNMPEDQLEMAINMTKKFMNPAMMFISTILGFTFMGALFSLITSIFVKKAPSPFDINTNEN